MFDTAFLQFDFCFFNCSEELFSTLANLVLMNMDQLRFVQPQEGHHFAGFGAEPIGEKYTPKQHVLAEQQLPNQCGYAAVQKHMLYWVQFNCLLKMQGLDLLLMLLISVNTAVKICLNF